TKESGNLYLTQLALGDAPSPMGVSAGPFTSLETEVTTSGYLRLVARSLTEEQLLAWELGETNLGTRVVLLENLRMLEWRVFHPQTLQWQHVWNDGMPLTAMRSPDQSQDQTGGPPGPGVPPPGTPPPTDQAGNELGRPLRPGLMELRFAMGNEPPQRWIFWVPSRASAVR
ncbi:MAG TPA: hypothetical protein VLE43_18405, partial [Candidatus Saccharimonadia bacterium]|nr:hypothetical protein [Candidatus Saccharimonadia bacterium]